MLNLGQILDGKYEIKRVLGQGGMGTVYLCENKRLGNLWAVKEINSQWKEKIDFLAEPNILKNLSHTGIVRIIDIFYEDDNLYLVEDYIEGKTLKEHVDDKGHLSSELVKDITLQLCSILDYLHNLTPPIIYRDLKPSNIMLTPYNKVVLIDFGIARTYKEGKAGDTVVLGSKGYIAPEQLVNIQSNTKTDIYSLGVTMFFMLTGKSISQLIELRLQESYPDGIDKELVNIVQKASAIDPENRYSDIKLMIDEINSITDNMKYDDTMAMNSNIADEEYNETVVMSSNTADEEYNETVAMNSNIADEEYNETVTMNSNIADEEYNETMAMNSNRANEKYNKTVAMNSNIADEEYNETVAMNSDITNEEYKKTTIMNSAEPSVEITKTVLEDNKNHKKRKKLIMIIALACILALVIFLVLLTSNKTTDKNASESPVESKVSEKTEENEQPAKEIVESDTIIRGVLDLNNPVTLSSGDNNAKDKNKNKGKNKDKNLQFILNPAASVSNSKLAISLTSIVKAGEDVMVVLSIENRNDDALKIDLSKTYLVNGNNKSVKIDNPNSNSLIQIPKSSSKQELDLYFKNFKFEGSQYIFKTVLSSDINKDINLSIDIKGNEKDD